MAGATRRSVYVCLARTRTLKGFVCGDIDTEIAAHPTSTRRGSLLRSRVLLAGWLF